MDFRLDRLEERAGALVARCERGASLTDLQAQYSADFPGFCDTVCGTPLMEHQREWARALQDDPLVALATGHSMGKDFLTARFALWWSFVRRGGKRAVRLRSGLDGIFLSFLATPLCNAISPLDRFVADGLPDGPGKLVKLRTRNVAAHLRADRRQ